MSLFCARYRATVEWKWEPVSLWDCSLIVIIRSKCVSPSNWCGTEVWLHLQIFTIELVRSLLRAGYEVRVWRHLQCTERIGFVKKNHHLLLLRKWQLDLCTCSLGWLGLHRTYILCTFLFTLITSRCSCSNNILHQSVLNISPQSDFTIRKRLSNIQ